MSQALHKQTKLGAVAAEVLEQGLAFQKAMDELDRLVSEIKKPFAHGISRDIRGYLSSLSIIAPDSEEVFSASSVDSLP